MAYATRYYDYQIAVIFAILLAGMLLLAMVVGAIYFICVVNMRGKKSGAITRVPSGRSTLRTRLDWPQQQQQFAPIQQQQQYPVQQQYPQPQEGYSVPQQQQPQYYPSPQQYDQRQTRVQELQPDYFQQQGPITYTSVYPYEQQQLHSYQPATSYHMSSV